VSAPESAVVFHLLAADNALAWGFRGPYLAFCGELVPASRLPPSCCPCGCDCDFLYCPECVREVADHNAEAGQADPAPASNR
jgi:hypothetical protein